MSESIKVFGWAFWGWMAVAFVAGALASAAVLFWLARVDLPPSPQEIL